MSRKVEGKNVPQFLDRRAAAEFIGLSDFWLAKHKSDPDAPPYIKYGRKCWYRRVDLELWVKERKERISHADRRLNDIWEQSAERKTMLPDEQDLQAQFEETHGSESVAVIIAHTINRVRKLNPKSLRMLVNTLNLIEEGAS